MAAVTMAAISPAEFKKIVIYKLLNLLLNKIKIAQKH